LKEVFIVTIRGGSDSSSNSNWSLY